MSKMDPMRATRPLDCHWCDRPIAIDEAIVTDALGRPLHVGACAALHAEFDNDPDDQRRADLIEQHGRVFGDDYYSGTAVATAYGDVSAIVGYPAAIVWRRPDGTAEIERHESLVHALLSLEEHRRSMWED